MRRWVAAATATLVAVVLSGCSAHPFNSVSLPGTEGTGSGSYTVKVELKNAAGLVPNNPVKLGDVNVGTVTDLAVRGWHAVATVSLRKGVTLPANTTATLGQTSLLGLKYIELSPPSSAPSRGTLTAGTTIPVSRSGAYPETEDVLAAVAALLNGGGLAQLRSIVVELNNVLTGRTQRIRDTLLQLDTFVRGLDAQRKGIVAAIDGVDRLGGRLANQNKVIEQILEDLPPALEVLNRQRPELVNALVTVGQLGQSADRVIARIDGDLARNLANLVPALRETADAGSSIVEALWLLPTLLFPMKTLDEAVNGDYADLWATIDLTFGSLDEGFLTGTAFEGALGKLSKSLASGTALSQQPAKSLTSGLGLQPRGGTTGPVESTERGQRGREKGSPSTHAAGETGQPRAPESGEKTGHAGSNRGGQNLLDSLLGGGG